MTKPEAAKQNASSTGAKLSSRAEAAMPRAAMASMHMASGRCAARRSATRVTRNITTAAQSQGTAVYRPTSRPTVVPSSSAMRVGR
ncbi:hypothetical protein D9M70_545500 [compost metagenome]